MSSKTAESTATSNSEVSGLFDQAFRAFGESLKVAMKAQEDTLKFWGEAAGKVNPMQSLVGDWIPAAQKNADEYLRLMESSYRRNADLLKKLIHEQNGSDGSTLNKRSQDWWEASMEVARDNAHDAAGTNLRVAQAWAEVFKKNTQQKVAAVK